MAQNINSEKSKPVTVRPTLVVGLGGTGCLAVKNIKRSLRDQIVITDLPFVKFLVIDTTTEESYGLSLNAGEFANLGSIDVNEIIDNLERYPHLQKWFPSKQIRPMQTGLGAGGVRHIGRVYYFQWRESSEIMGRIKNDIRLLMDPRLPYDTHQIEELQNLNINVDLEHGINIHIISSVVGGTGAGILLDLAYDLRRWCIEGGAGLSIITAHLVLPEAFYGRVPTELHEQLQANAYACLSEINHFIRHGKWQVEYQKEEVAEKSRSPFDYIYLVNGHLEKPVRDYYALASVIGKTIQTLLVTPLGSMILQREVNISQAKLGNDDEHGQPIAYSSYGLATGSVHRGRLCGEISKGLFHRAAMKALWSSDADSRRSEDSANRLAGEIDDLIENIDLKSPKIAEIVWKAGAEGDRDGVVPDVERYESECKSIQREAETLWRKELDQVFSISLHDGVHQQLQNLWNAQNSLNCLNIFVSAILEYLERLKNQAESRRNKSGEQGRQSSTEITSLLGSVTDFFHPTQLKTYLELLLRREQSDYDLLLQSLFVDLLGQAIRQIREGIKRRLDSAMEVCRAISDEATESAQRNRGFKMEKEGLAEAPAERFELCQEEIKTIITRDHSDECLANWGHTLFQDLDASTGNVLRDLHNQLRDSLEEIAEKMTIQIIEPYQMGLELDVHKISELLEKEDREVLKSRLQELINAACPSIRLGEQYARLKRLTINYIGVRVVGRDLHSAELTGSPVLRGIRDIDKSCQAAVHNFCEVPIIRFLYGFPLWAVESTKKWEEAFDLKYNENEQVFLDPSWQKKIHPFNPLSASESELVSYFFLANMEQVNLITVDALKKWRLGDIILGETPDQAFKTFVNLVNTDRSYWENLKAKVDKKLEELKTTDKIIEALDKHKDKQVVKLEKPYSQGSREGSRKLILLGIRALEAEKRRLSSQVTKNNAEKVN